jgi:hypothetical protein
MLDYNIVSLRGLNHKIQRDLTPEF